MIEGAAGFVLAGGQSRRMGRDKASLPFAGQPLIARAVAILQRAGLETAIAGERADLAVYAPVVEDRVHAQGPLGGICSALESMTVRWGVFLPVDVPLMPADYIVYLLRHARNSGAVVTIASVHRVARVFPAVLDRAVLPTLRTHLESGQRRCFDAFEAGANACGQQMAVVPAETLEETGAAGNASRLAAGQWFLNVNTPDDLAQAESLARHGIA